MATRRGATAAQVQLRGGLSDVRAASQRFGGLQQQFESDLERGRTSELRDITAARAADVQQAAGAAGAPTNVNDATNRAIGRARGLSRVISGTSNEFKSQLLKDRISAVAQGRRRGGAGLQAIADVGGFEERIEAARRGTSEAERATRKSVIGTGLGIAAGFAPEVKSFFQERRLDKEFGPAVQEGVSSNFNFEAGPPLGPLNA